MEGDLITDYISEYYYVGSIHYDSYGNKLEILGKSKSRSDRIWVKFEGSDLILITDTTSIKNKKFNSRLTKKFLDVGYLGYGKYKTNGNSNIIYSTWKNMLKRCYSNNLEFISYRSCKVCEEWHNYQNFAKWYDENYIEGYELDKDLLQQDVINKIYSPETCCFLPKHINLFLQDKNTTSKGTTNVLGVTISKSSGKPKYRASININSINKNLGEFIDLIDAENCYIEAYNNKLEILNKELRNLVLIDIKNKFN